MPERRIVEVERVDILVCVRPKHRHYRWIWFELADAPELNSGEKGWYEIERIRNARPRGRKWRMIGPAACPFVPGGPC